MKSKYNCPIGKGFAIGAAALTVALMRAYIEKISGNDSSFVLAINDPLVLGYVSGEFSVSGQLNDNDNRWDAAFDMIKEIHVNSKKSLGFLMGKQNLILRVR